MRYEAAIPFLVGPPVRVTLADPSAPLEPVCRVGPPPAPEPVIDAEAARRAAEREREERERLESVLGQLLDAARDLQAAQRGRLEEMQRVAVEVAVAVASHVLYERIESGDYPVEDLVREAVKRLGPPQGVTVRLHPEDLALLERRAAEGPLFALDTEELRLVADPSLGRGDCRAETGEVAVMAHLEEHLAEIRRDLLHALSEAEVERRKPAGERGLRRYPDRRHTA